MLIDELRATFLTGGLTDSQLADLIEVGERLAFATGDELFREGEPAEQLWILLDGHIELYRASSGEISVMMTMETPGQWAGGLRAWGDASLGAGYRASGRAASDGHAFLVPSQDLGRLVEEWFPFGKHMINGVYQTIRNIDAMARQRESLVALGTLAAGLAHEINNPAAAAMRAVEGLRDTCDSMLESLVDLAERSVTAEQFVQIDGSAATLAERDVPDDGAVARMDREDAIGDWLSRKGVENAWQLAPLYAAAGADRAWLDEFAERGRHRAALPRAPLGIDDDQRDRPPRRADRHHEEDLESRRRGLVVFTARPHVAAQGRRARGARQHAGDAVGQARPRRRRAVVRSRPRARSTGTVPNSTRCGRT